MSCTRASKFLEDNDIAIRETVPASRKLQADDAEEIARSSSKIIVAKGKKVTELKGGDKTDDTVVNAMLGPTGNLRAPTIRRGKTTLVGFNQEVYESVF